jgi:hypothetical protein
MFCASSALKTWSFAGLHSLSRKFSAPCPDFKNLIATKLCIGIGHMSNQRKAEFITGNFGIYSFWEGHDKILPKSWFRPKGPVSPEFWFSNTVEFSIVVTRKSLNVWGYVMDHQKAERVSYHDGIWYFQSFGQSETRKLCSVQPLFCPETEISSEVDFQKSVTSKPLGG